MSNPFEEIKKLLADLRMDHKEIQRAQKALHAEQERVSHHHVLPRSGVDYAFPPYPPAEKIKSAGFSFVGRYLTDPENRGKALSRGEAESLSHAGIDIFVFFEEGERNAEEGYEAGVRDSRKAMDALNRLHPIGQPPIYMVCDFDAQGEGKTGNVLEYVRGSTHAIGWHRTGLYAGLYVLEAAVKQNRCKFFCQSQSWHPHGLWLPEAQLLQMSEIKLFGADCDIEHARSADFGQFRVR